MMRRAIEGERAGTPCAACFELARQDIRRLFLEEVALGAGRQRGDDMGVFADDRGDHADRFGTHEAQTAQYFQTRSVRKAEIDQGQIVVGTSRRGDAGPHVCGFDDAAIGKGLADDLGEPAAASR